MVSTDTAAGEATDGHDESWRGKIGVIQNEELDEFLGGGHICRLATLDENDWPYIQPVWFAWESEEQIFWIIARAKSAWAKHLQANGKAALSIDENGPPYRKVFVQGRAEVVEEPNVGGRWVDIARGMSVRYLGEHGPDYLIPTLNQPRWLFRVTPEKFTTWQGVQWAKRYRE